MAPMHPPSAPADLLWLFTSFSGRISREVFWLGLGLVWMAGALAISLAIGDPVAFYERIQAGDSPEAAVLGNIMSILLPLTLWVEVVLVVKRAHDCDITGFVAMLMLVPLVNLLVVIYFGLTPGSRGANRFGQATNARR